MDDSSNTTPKQGGVTGKGFTKGDPRINRNGRPKSFDQLRALAQQIAHETAKAGGNTVVIEGHAVTVAEAVIRQWFQSKEFAKQKAALHLRKPRKFTKRSYRGGFISLTREGVGVKVSQMPLLLVDCYG